MEAIGTVGVLLLLVIVPLVWIAISDRDKTGFNGKPGELVTRKKDGLKTKILCRISRDFYECRYVDSGIRFDTDSSDLTRGPVGT